jgi:hypothetical protein
MAPVQDGLVRFAVDALISSWGAAKIEKEGLGSCRQERKEDWRQ